MVSVECQQLPVVGDQYDHNSLCRLAVLRAHNATAHAWNCTGCLYQPERIQFKLAVLVFRCLRGTAPPYLADQLQPVAALESRRRLRSSASARLTSRGRDRPPQATVHSVSSVFTSGTVCRHRRRVHLRCLFLGGCWNANCSIAVTICAN